MTGVSAVWSVLVLGAAAAVGAAIAAVAQAYARRVSKGEPVDGATLWRSSRDAGGRFLPGTSPPGSTRRWPAPRWLLACAALLATAALPLALAPSSVAALRLAACVVLLLLAAIDASCRLLPDALTLPLLWAGLLAAWAGTGPTLDDAVAGAAVGYMVLWLTDSIFRTIRRRPGMGGGDMKLLAALGAWLGWAAVPHTLLAACCGGILYAIGATLRPGSPRALARRCPRWRRSIAFGPFLALAGAVGLVGEPVVQLLF